MRKRTTTRKQMIEERAENVGIYIRDRKVTVRAAAKAFDVSKSTIHKDVTERLLNISPILAQEVREVLDQNKEERHIRGGQATRRKYLRMQE